MKWSKLLLLTVEPTLFIAKNVYVEVNDTDQLVYPFSTKNRYDRRSTYGEDKSQVLSVMLILGGLQ